MGGAFDVAHKETSRVARGELVVRVVESIEERSSERTEVGESNRVAAVRVFRDLSCRRSRGAIARVSDIGSGLSPEGRRETRIEKNSADSVEEGQISALDAAVLRVNISWGERVLDPFSISPARQQSVEELTTQI